MRLEGDDLAFLARFATTPDAVRLIEILQAELKDTERLMRNSSGEETHKLQGRVQQLDKLLTDISGASTKLARSKPPQKREFLQASNP